MRNQVVFSIEITVEISQLHNIFTKTPLELLLHYYATITRFRKGDATLVRCNNMPIAINHFDDTIFRLMVEKEMVSKDKKLTFKFRNGKEIQI